MRILLCIIIGLQVNLLEIAPQTDLSECSSLLSSHFESSTDTETKAPVSDQAAVHNAIAGMDLQIHSAAASYQPTPLPHSSHKNNVKDGLIHNESDTSDHLDTERSMFSILQKSSDQLHVHMKSLSTAMHLDSSYQEYSTNIDLSGQISSSIISSKSIEPLQVMLRYHDKLVIALSLDPKGVAGVLLARGLIPENTEAQMHQHSTPSEKATILVTAVRRRIEVTPK